MVFFYFILLQNTINALASILNSTSLSVTSANTTSSTPSTSATVRGQHSQLWPGMSTALSSPFWSLGVLYLSSSICLVSYESTPTPPPPPTHTHTSLTLFLSLSLSLSVAYTAQFESCERTPAKNRPAFFFFALSHRGLFFRKWIESEWVWQAFFCDTRTEIAIVQLQETCNGGGRVGRGSGHQSRSPKTRCERGAQGIAVGVVKAMWCSLARLSKRKEQISSAWAVVCGSFIGLRFWRLTPFDGQYNAVKLGWRTRVTTWASVDDNLEFAEPGKYSS